ncbi:MAG: hypothetical protein JWM21_2310 [Acidobacteria bacterium]|nr:hypothetical protein [Acidobacteriota bacterium]
MRQIDMSREAVTARLKLVSELRRLCLSLQTAKVKSQPATKQQDMKQNQPGPNSSERSAK